ncbi:hypothetical protein HBI56_210530 [Parastagonospora nodorum]|uniref:Uncharacterized protein n=1 Tax=Phaeosphaeria nodorum (strain SN15 / ATCC MYA-4574 / FGSC 10173) TaxID=321614 RepID=A0A7U2F3M2_PHANO|nr:hypothetical protein HBH56_213770 [Parastagonospora nodorum]QRC97836.1 hypothetical protein JI435_411120 [Parastagonospora nodorum SN15]KAH3923103.1 hypothetical protein HBH54_215440 [Parastagonospora nodorum]KAH3941847.1 hypothetical protein HBH53_196650 [Parastagonospora nodorum]KAH3960930.1 hypothetical protein HBH51_186470 [Parastagonospora nodorum]
MTELWLMNIQLVARLSSLGQIASANILPEALRKLGQHRSRTIRRWCLLCLISPAIAMNIEISESTRLKPPVINNVSLPSKHCLSSFLPLIVPSTLSIKRLKPNH